MASVVEICNGALIALGTLTINSLDDEVESARLCSSKYDHVRDLVLEAHPWNCATARAQLPASDEAPVFGWSLAYPKPADCLKVRSVHPTTDTKYRLEPGEFSVEGGSILSNDGPPLFIVYTRRVTDPNLMSTLLREAISARLAMELSEAFSQSQTMTNLLAQMYEAKIKNARFVDGQESPQQVERSCEWVEVRR